MSVSITSFCFFPPKLLIPKSTILSMESVPFLHTSLLTWSPLLLPQLWVHLLFNWVDSFFFFFPSFCLFVYFLLYKAWLRMPEKTQLPFGQVCFHSLSLISVPGAYLNGCWYLHSLKFLGNNNIWHTHWYLTWRAEEKRAVLQKALIVIDLYEPWITLEFLF